MRNAIAIRFPLEADLDALTPLSGLAVEPCPGTVRPCPSAPRPSVPRPSVPKLPVPRLTPKPLTLLTPGGSTPSYRKSIHARTETSTVMASATQMASPSALTTLRASASTRSGLPPCFLHHRSISGMTSRTTSASTHSTAHWLTSISAPRRRQTA